MFIAQFNGCEIMTLLVFKLIPYKPCFCLPVSTKSLGKMKADWWASLLSAFSSQFKTRLMNNKYLPCVVVLRKMESDPVVFTNNTHGKAMGWKVVCFHFNTFFPLALCQASWPIGI